MTPSVSPASLLEVDLLLTPQKATQVVVESVDRGARSPSPGTLGGSCLPPSVRLGGRDRTGPSQFSSPGPRGSRC